MAAKYRWGVLGSSVIGASHVRSGKPNQDAIKHTAQETLPMVLALSDGHGSASSFRSDIGSKLAVDAAIDTLLEFIDQVGNISASKRKGLAEEKLPRLLVENWAGAVDVHRGENPFTVSETKQVIRAAGKAGAQRVLENPLLAYGATLLCVAVAWDYILYLQLGDGDIVVVSEDGEAQRALPKDDDLMGNETTSLCMQNAWLDTQVIIPPIVDPPAMILVSTDGYVNSFRDDAGFMQVGPDILGMVRENDIDFVKEELESWLSEASETGSGDDITLGIICRLGEK